MDAAYGVLLGGEEGARIADHFIESAFPTRDEVRQVLEALDAAPWGLSVPSLLGEINVSMGRIEKTIALLSLESPAPIAKQGTKWQLTAANLSDEFWQRAERLTRLRREEQREMREYVGLESGHMEFLIQALDGDPGKVQPPDLPILPTVAEPVLVREAASFLRRTRLPIEPRRRWPVGGMPQYDLHGLISPEYRAEPGKALCIWGDAGWGGLVRRGKNRDDRFSDDLARVCALLLERWAPRPAPAWVTCIPSRRHRELVPDFAERLAMHLGLPFHQSLEKVEDRAEQKSMANSTQRARNVDGSIALSRKRLLCTPVLLVDDMVDSRWTLTVAA